MAPRRAMNEKETIRVCTWLSSCGQNIAETRPARAAVSLCRGVINSGAGRIVFDSAGGCFWAGACDQAYDEPKFAVYLARGLCPS